MTAGAPLLGSTVAEARAAEFFAWFQLAPAERPERFRPSGDAFHDLAALDVRADGSDRRIIGLTLRLARRFIDDQRNGVFARDLMKSFLRAAIPPDALSTIPALPDALAAIEDFSRSGATLIVNREAPWERRAPARTPPYDVYLGSAAAWSATSNAAYSIVIRMTNEMGETGDDASHEAILVTEITTGASR